MHHHPKFNRNVRSNAGGGRESACTVQMQNNVSRDIGSLRSVAVGVQDGRDKLWVRVKDIRRKTGEWVPANDWCLDSEPGVTRGTM